VKNKKVSCRETPENNTNLHNKKAKDQNICFSFQLAFNLAQRPISSLLSTDFFFYFGQIKSKPIPAGQIDNHVHQMASLP
jgi:hypothetical protein